MTTPAPPRTETDSFGPTGLDLREAALQAGGISAADHDAWVDARRTLAPD